MQIEFWAEYGKENCNAGFKARQDVCSIVDSMAIAQNYDVSFAINDSSTKWKKLFGYYRLFLHTMRLKRGSAVIVQYPCRKILNCIRPFMKKINVIAIIHDIDSVRFPNPEGLAKEIEQLNCCKVVITHNEKMTQLLQNAGLKTPCVALQMFDYLAIPQEQKNGGQGIVFAGNISKSKFLSDLSDDILKYTIKLYGPINKETILSDKVQYMGCYDSTEIVKKLQGKYALVWDGESTKTCTGDVGKYTQYNNPHKFSLYIAAGLPVIVWRKAAIAEFVEKHQLGFAVDSLQEAAEKIASITEGQYRVMSERVKRLQKDVTSGCFLKKAIQEALKETDYEQ